VTLRRDRLHRMQVIRMGQSFVPSELLRGRTDLGRVDRLIQTSSEDLAD
jgi:hypothetical protein